MHRGMLSYRKEWMHQNYGTECKLSRDKEHENSVMLNIEVTPQRVQDVDF